MMSPYRMKGLGPIFARCKGHVRSGDLIYNSMHIMTMYRGVWRADF